MLSKPALESSIERLATFAKILIAVACLNSHTSLLADAELGEYAGEKVFGRNFSGNLPQGRQGVT